MTDTISHDAVLELYHHARRLSHAAHWMNVYTTSPIRFADDEEPIESIAAWAEETLSAAAQLLAEGPDEDLDTDAHREWLATRQAAVVAALDQAGVHLLTAHESYDRLIDLLKELRDWPSEGNSAWSPMV